MRLDFHAILFVTTLTLSAACRAHVDDISRVQDADSAAAPALPPLPLRTSGRWIVDALGHRAKLACVNWAGAESQDFVVAGLQADGLTPIAKLIRSLGFNCVRLPWSNELLHRDPLVDQGVLKANPEMTGKHAMAILDDTVNAITANGLMVVLDNHMSDAEWCCSDNDDNGLWYNARFDEAQWIKDWKAIVTRYAAVPGVVGADLRNEPRQGARWGGDPSHDWRAAATRGGNAVLSVNKSLLIFVEGTGYGANLQGVRATPVILDTPDRLVYSVHDYSWFHGNGQTYGALKAELDDAWGFIPSLSDGARAPVWVGEFGTCHTGPDCLTAPGANGAWFQNFMTYLRETDLDFAYWSVNGTQSTGTGRVLFAPEDFGVLDVTWRNAALPGMIEALKTVDEPSAL